MAVLALGHHPVQYWHWVTIQFSTGTGSPSSSVLELGHHPVQYWNWVTIQFSTGTRSPSSSPCGPCGFAVPSDLVQPAALNVLFIDVKAMPNFPWDEDDSVKSLSLVLFPMTLGSSSLNGP